MLSIPFSSITLNCGNMRKRHIVISIFFLSFLFGACAKKMSFERSTVVPGANGKVAVKKDNNDNFTITVNTVNLPSANHLEPSREVYVVWMEDGDKNVKKLGQIKPTTGLLSKAYKGELRATSTSKPRKIFITAEDGGALEYPGDLLVLTTDE
jgi:hypothetical protein